VNKNIPNIVPFLVLTASVLAALAPTQAVQPDAPAIAQEANATYKGQVIAASGEPAAGVPIKLYARQARLEPDAPDSFDPSVAQPRPVRQVQTDDNGNFNITGLKPNIYRAFVGQRGTEEGFAIKTFRLSSGQVLEEKIQLKG